MISIARFAGNPCERCIQVSQQSISKEAASTLRIGSLCTGYGGLDLAVEAHFNSETIWCAEFDKYASKVREQRFDIPNYGNIKEIDWATLPEIDILTAGYPCQPFSHAGAPHRRERIFIVAQPTNSDSIRQPLGQDSSNEDWNQGQPQSEPSSLGETAINATSEFKSSDEGMQGLGRKFTSRRDMYMQTSPNALDQDGKLNALFVEYMMGLPVGWVTDSGLSRAQQLKMLGNGVVPQQAELALELLTPVDNYGTKH